VFTRRSLLLPSLLLASLFALSGCGLDWKLGLYTIEDSEEDGGGSIPADTLLGDATLNAPRGVAQKGGFLYVADANTNKIYKFNPSLSGQTGELLWNVGGFGTGNLEFNDPEGIAVGPSGAVYVVDSGNQRVQKFNDSGIYLGTIGAVGDLGVPVGVAVDSLGNVYVSDAATDLVVVFDALGNKSGEIDGTTELVGNFLIPAGLAVGWWGGSEYLYVVDRGNRQIKYFALRETLTEANTGAYGSAGTGDGQFQSPWGVAVDGYGRIYVSDESLENVQKFEQETGFVSLLLEPTDGEGPFTTPVGLAASLSRLYVAEDQAGWVRIVDSQDF